MKYITYRKHGGPDVLELSETPTPKPGPGEVRIQVRAAGVNPVDIQTRQGAYAEITHLPGKLGVEVAGVVDALGAGVSSLRVGESVYYVPRLLENEGGYATHHVERHDLIARMPHGLSFEQAAAVPLAGGTAWETLIERARLAPGERALILGGSGGVGVYALQVARLVGAEATCTARLELSDDLRALGCDAVVDYRAEDALAQLRDTGPFDVALDTVGGNSIRDLLGLLNPRGRIVSIVDQHEPQDLYHGWEVNAEIHLLLTTQSGRRLTRMARCIERGQIRPVIESTFTLDKASEAHARIERGGRMGKIVLRVDQ
jgi:NADPH:quinone reductase-like Zn-dependent oxidoreductase